MISLMDLMNLALNMRKLLLDIGKDIHSHKRPKVKLRVIGSEENVLFT
jgi:hypothetical protein